MCRKLTMQKDNQPIINGILLCCKHCGGHSFQSQRVKLDRQALGGFIHLEGIWGSNADIHTCCACGYLHWFSKQGEEPQNEWDSPDHATSVSSQEY